LQILDAFVTRADGHTASVSSELLNFNAISEVG